MSSWIKKELKGGKHYPGGDEVQVDKNIHDLNEEFKVIYGELSQKVLKVPISFAKKIAENHGVPLALGLVSYQIDQDGILSAETVCELLKREYGRLNSVDYPVPPIESSQLDFAIREGEWIEYLYRRFSRQISDQTATLSTLESLLTSKEIPFEKVSLIIYDRRKITRGLITPVIHRWITSHRQGNALLGSLVIVEAILKSPNKLEKAKLFLSRKVEEVRSMLSKLKSALGAVNLESWSSREVEPVKKIALEVEKALSDIELPLESMSKESLAELIVQLMVKEAASSASIEKGSYLVVTSPIPSHGELHPLLGNPYDFLERDIRLAKQREDSHEFLQKTVQKVHRILAGETKQPIEVAVDMILQMHDRFTMNKKPRVEELLPKLERFVHKEQMEDPKSTERVDLDSLCDFMTDYFLDNFFKPKSAVVGEISTKDQNQN
ncbi:MAG: hypothetical protein WED05_00940 [Candidatus Atabeyarchaeum deiterrae]